MRASANQKPNAVPSSGVSENFIPQTLGFRESDRRMASREVHLRVTLERDIDRYPGVPTPGVHPYIP